MARSASNRLHSDSSSMIGTRDLAADLGQHCHLGVRHRLLDDGDAERLQARDARHDLGRRPGLVGIDAQVDVAGHPAPANGLEAGDVVLPGDADLDLHLAKAVDPHPPHGNAHLQPARAEVMAPL